MRKKRKSLPVWLIGMALVLGSALSIQIYAANASVTFGSNWYEKSNGETFPVGVYIRSEGGAGNYNVTIGYDPQRLEYIGGADGADTGSGILTLSGDNGDAEIKYWLSFRAVSGGDTEIWIDSAVIYTENNEELYEITSYGRAPVHVEGDEGALDEEEGTEEEEQLQQEETGNEEEGDLQQEETGNEEEGDLQQEEAGNEEEEPLQQEEAGTGEEELLQQEGAALEEGEPLQQERADAAQNPAGEGDPEDAEKTSILFNVYVVLIFASAALVAIVVIIILLIQKLLGRKDTAKSAVKNIPKHREHDLNIIDLNEDTFVISAQIQSYIHDSEMSGKLGEPVIRIEDVTMEFHLSSYNPSGIKDYMIQLLKRQIVYRKLYALYHVSFNVYKGEVLGIIGTNGSGKSTLLKIISGALRPTGGRVKVDHRKVQLLTLGTGFDMELTARENVYLNGSIIGYSREFLDRHYNDIVEFAELKDFMEEKVKNFSSGMVSRLGFAIATAGDAAEILILDEVLSVGDEFFRKKSLARIKEMIHGGSTVLLVSHGMGTILENCTKVVWIEKGELRMIGEPEVVCGEYRGMYG